MAVFYVTFEDERVAGPFESREAARRVADEENTYEVGAGYRVERAEDD